MSLTPVSSSYEDIGGRALISRDAADTSKIPAAAFVCCTSRLIYTTLYTLLFATCGRPSDTSLVARLRHSRERVPRVPIATNTVRDHTLYKLYYI